jgi:hypothetical protein
LNRITGLVQWVSAEAVSTVNVCDCGGLFGGASRAYALDLIGIASTTKAHGKVAMLGCLSQVLMLDVRLSISLLLSNLTWSI